VRISFPRTFFAKICAIYSLLTLSLTAGELCVLYTLWTRANYQQTQVLHWELAQSFARELREEFKRGNADEIRLGIARLSEFNPAIGAFVLDHTGKVVISSTALEIASDFRVPVNVLERFLKPQLKPNLPIYGPDPLLRRTQKPFSAARVTLGEKPAYLYILLEGRFNHAVKTALLDRYLIVGGVLSSCLIGGVTVALGTALFFFLTRRFSRLSQTVGRIAAGEHSARTGVSGHDEIGELGTQINNMAEKIESSLQLIRAADEARRRTLVHLSHDLRSPVAALHAHVELLNEQLDSATVEDNRLHLRAMLSNIGSLTQLLADLFDLAQLDSGELKPHFEEFSLLDVISEEVLPELSPIASLHGIELSLAAPERLELVKGDIKMIYRVLVNLAKNAIVHNRAGGSVVIELETNAAGILVRVRDTGPGIAESELKQIFEQYYTGRRHSGGTGIGLAIVKRVLDLHGADIAVRSKLEEGTEFSFTLHRAHSPSEPNGLSEGKGAAGE
jgi:two-component system OmpR family sensor kinase